MLSEFQKIMLRLTLLFLLMLGLFAFYNSKQEEKAQKLAAEKQSKIDDQIRRLGYNDPKLRAEKPLDVPDFGDVPVYLISGDYLKLSQNIYRDAEKAREKVRAFKLKKAGKALNESIDLSLNENVATARDFNEKYRKFRYQELDAYRELTTDKAEVKAAGEEFLNAYLLNAMRQPDSFTDAEVFQLANKVVELGSQDPLLRTYVAFVLYRGTGDAIAAEAMWIDSIEKLRISQYPLIVQVYLRLLVVDCRPSWGVGQEHALIINIIRWLEAESNREQWVDCVHHKLAGIWDQNKGNFRDKLLVCCLKSKKIDPFIKHWLIGVRTVEKAWDIRQGRFANDMGPAEYHYFQTYMKRGGVHLEYAYFLRPDSVLPPSKLMSIALAGVDRDYEPVDWFRRSVENRFDYYPPYHSLLNSMLPRWGGNLDQSRNFAQQCIGSNRFDTHVPYFVIDMLQNLLNWEFKNYWEQLESFGANELVDEFLAQRTEYREAHPGEKLYGDTAYYRTRLGLFLEKSGRPDDAIAEYKAAQGDLDFSQLQHDHRLGKFLLSRLFAAQGEVHGRVMQFDKELRKPWPANTALSEIDQLEKEWQELKPTAKDDRARQYYAHTGKILKQLKSYFQGDWVDLSFREKGLGWEISSDQIDWSRHDHNELICRETLQRQSPWARPLVNFEAPFQIQTNVEENASYPGRTQIGVRWTDFNTTNDEKTENKTQLYAGFHRNWSYPKSKNPNEFQRAEDLNCSHSVHFVNPKLSYLSSQFVRPKNTGMNLIDWKIREDSCEVTLGNFLEFIRLDEPAPQQSHLIFSSDIEKKTTGARCTSEYVWKLKDVRIRRLSTEKVPAEEVPFDKRIAYWEKRVKNDPDDIVGRYKLCQVYWSNSLGQKLLDLSNAMLAKWPEMEKIQKFRGLAFHKLGRYREALASFELVRKELGEDIDVIMISAEIGSASLNTDPRSQKQFLELAEFGKRCSANRHIDLKAIHWAALAVTYANNNRYEDALQANQQAITLAEENLKNELLDRQKLYEAASPYHYPSDD